MDRDQLLRTLPNAQAFHAAQSWKRKEIVETFVSSILDAIEDEHREPDDWEAHDIASATGFIAAGMYYAALACAERALVPPEQRSPIPAMNSEDPPAMRHLREALAYVGGMPARNC